MIYYNYKEAKDIIDIIKNKALPEEKNISVSFSKDSILITSKDEKLLLKEEKYTDEDIRKLLETNHPVAFAIAFDYYAMKRDFNSFYNAFEKLAANNTIISKHADLNQRFRFLKGSKEKINKLSGDKIEIAKIVTILMQYVLICCSDYKYIFPKGFFELMTAPSGSSCNYVAPSGVLWGYSVDISWKSGGRLTALLKEYLEMVDYFENIFEGDKEFHKNHKKIISCYEDIIPSADKCFSYLPYFSPVDDKTLERTLSELESSKDAREYFFHSSSGVLQYKGGEKIIAAAYEKDPERIIDLIVFAINEEISKRKGLSEKDITRLRHFKMALSGTNETLLSNKILERLEGFSSEKVVLSILKDNTIGE